MAAPNFDFSAASSAPCCCLPEDNIFTCDSCCNSFSPMAQLLQERFGDAQAPSPADTDDVSGGTCTDCLCVPCFCHSSNYITSSRINSAAAEQPDNETAPAPSPAPLPAPPPTLAPIADNLVPKMKAFIAAAAIMFEDHNISNIADAIFDDWHVKMTSRHATWDEKRDWFNLALHQCNYMMHVTDKIMDDLDDYNFTYFKAACCRRNIKHVAAKLVNYWATEGPNYLACSAESQ